MIHWLNVHNLSEIIRQFKNFVTDRLPLDCDDQILSAAIISPYLLMMTTSLVSNSELSRYETLQYLILHLKYLWIPDKMCICM